MLNQKAMLNFELRLIEFINICYIGNLHLSQLRIDQEQNGGCILSMPKAPCYANLVNHLDCGITSRTWTPIKGNDSSPKWSSILYKTLVCTRLVVMTLFGDVFPNKKLILIYLITVIHHGGHASVDKDATKILYIGFL